MNLDINSNIEENLEITQSVISETLSVLNGAPDGDRKAVLINFLNEFSREAQRLIDNREDLTLTAIHVRNIFELFLLAKHVFTDEKALNSWLGQLHKDTADIIDGFSSLFSKHGKDVPELEEWKKYIDETLEESKFKSKGPFNIKDLANKFGFEEDYSAIHKLCSKIVHPSSIKVNTHGALVANDNFSSLLVYVGDYFCKQFEGLCDEIKDEYKA